MCAKSAYEIQMTPRGLISQKQHCIVLIAHDFDKYDLQGHNHTIMRKKTQPVIMCFFSRRGAGIILQRFRENTATQKDAYWR